MKYIATLIFVIVLGVAIEAATQYSLDSQEDTIKSENIYEPDEPNAFWKFMYSLPMI